MMYKNKYFSIIAIFIFALPMAIAGCASESNSIKASYVSPLKYRNYTCDQLTEEYARVLEESRTVNKSQDDTAANDAVAMGVGLVLFWPALFFIDSDDQKEDVARLKGELKAVETAAIRKDCTSLRQVIREDKKQLKTLRRKPRKHQVIQKENHDQASSAGKISG